MRIPLGVVLYQGPSLLNEQPIVTIATGLHETGPGASENAKTGNMVQTYILVDQRLPPWRAVRSGKDAAICGDCPLRSKVCYVNMISGVHQVHKSYRQGNYPHYVRKEHAKFFRGRAIRFGSYGDPAAVPLWVWRELHGLASSSTGYTHQWRTCSARYRKYVMASVEDEAGMVEAQALGYRTFRIRLPAEPILANEIECPASEEQGKRLTCAQCGACWGNRPGGKAASVTIVAHGPPNKIGSYRKLRELPVLGEAP